MNVGAAGREAAGRRVGLGRSRVRARAVRDRPEIADEQGRRNACVVALLNGQDATPAMLTRVGLASERSLVVAVFEDHVPPTESAGALSARLTDIAELHLRASPLGAVAASVDGKLFVVAELAKQDDRVALRRVIEKCLSHASRALRLDLRAGIGRTVIAVGQLWAARQTAEDCLASTVRSQPVVSFEEIRGRALMGEVERAVATWHGGPSSVFRTLTDLDTAGSTEYARTLLSVLESFGNTNKAAVKLHVHTNTVRYRMRRILELTKIDLEDGEERLALELELRARLRGAPGGETSA